MGRLHCPHCGNDVYPVDHWDSGYLFFRQCPRCGKLIKNYYGEGHKNPFDIPSPWYEIFVAVFSFVGFWAIALLAIGLYSMSGGTL